VTPDLRAKALEIHLCLRAAYGEPERLSDPDPVRALVLTILSQNTNDRLRDMAFDRLQAAFPTWEQVRDAPAQAIARAIQIAGLGQQKAQHIKGALQRITDERGALSLGFLKEMPLDEAKRWLLSIRGVGRKTAAIVLLFTLDKPAFPVDTHIHRVSKRLGLIPGNASRDKAHDLLEALLPPETYYSFHINLIQHGREVCQARRPRCEACSLRHTCDYYAAFTAENAESAEQERIYHQVTKTPRKTG